jgi:RNA polymerase sigma factor (sigma-70 family)
MPTILVRITGHLQRLVRPRRRAGDSDAALLRLFIRQRDEAAFATLVTRHGPMVHRLCRRVTGNATDADDASQATFLVLVRKAASIRRPSALAAWLHGVAYRVARKTRERRPEMYELDEGQADRHPDPLDELTARELLTIIDEEVQRLPERYRLPIVLCYLEGRTQEDAARLLGWTPGSVKGRLERARSQLHTRLTRRGLTLSAALAPLILTEGSWSAGGPDLLEPALRGPARTQVTSLTEAEMKRRATTSRKLVTALVLMIGVVALFVGGLRTRGMLCSFEQAELQLQMAHQASVQLNAIREDPEAPRLDPKLAPADSNLGPVLVAKGQQDEATREHNGAPLLDPSDALPLPDFKLAWVHANLGNALRNKGRLDEAIQEYREALRLDPIHAMTHNDLGLALRTQGKLDEAIREYREALRLDPTLAPAYANLGIALRSQGRLDEAVAVFQEAIRLENAAVCGIFRTLPIP